MEKNCNWWSNNITRSTRNHLLQIHVGSLTILSLQFGTLKKWCAIKCFSVLSIISIRIYKCVCVRTNLQFKYIQKSLIKDTPTKGQCIDNLS